MKLHMGPQHPATHGVLHIALEVEGERVVSLEPDVGYLHRCAEKLGERDRYLQALVHTDRMDYVAAMSQNLAYVLAVEDLLGIKVPTRAQVLRVLICEFQRVASHLVWLGTHVLDLGAMSVFFYGMREREKILDLFEEACGARLTYSHFRFGGFRHAPTPRFYELARELVRNLPHQIDEMEELLAANPILKSRLVGVGVISKEEAIGFGVSGPALRASGVDRDLRKAVPYSGYDAFTFRVPVRTEGDGYARFLVRIDEMRESVKICEQALSLLADDAEGEWIADDPLVVAPPRGEIYADMAKMTRHWILAIHGFKVPEGEVYRAVEAPRGEFGVYVRSDGSAKPYRVHYRSPCFFHLQCLEPMSKGELIADVAANIGSLDFVIGETDR